MLFLKKDEIKTKIKQGKSIFGKDIEVNVTKKDLKKSPLSLKYSLYNKFTLRLYSKKTDKIITLITT